MKKKIKEVVIDSFSQKGLGVGETEHGSVVEVPFTMPGDRVEALVIRRRKSLLEQVINPSAQRQDPQCQHFGSCGGCMWQHIPYELQVAEKKQRIQTLFPEYSGSFVEAETLWQYRNKMEFSFTQDKAGTPYLGLMMLGSKGKAFNLEECPICDPWFAEVVKKVRTWWSKSGLEAYYPPADRGSLRTLTLRRGVRTGSTLVMLTVSGNPDFALSKSQLESFSALFNEGAVFVRIQQLVKGKKTQFYEIKLKEPEHVEEELHIFGKKFRFKISPTAFFQPNTLQAEKIYENALNLAQIGPEETVLDLYCGTGTLTMLAASRAKKAIGVEILPDAVYDAKENAELNGIENVEFIKGDVGEVVKTLETPDLVVVDPPRVGLEGNALGNILSLKPKRILYISCNPKTQSRDISQMENYEIVNILPVDQFPHTVHMENIILLKRKS